MLIYAFDVQHINVYIRSLDEKSAANEPETTYSPLFSYLPSLVAVEKAPLWRPQV